MFVECIDRAKDLFHELIYDGINVDVMHSGRTQAQRDNLIKCFRTGKVEVNVSYAPVLIVLNYDLDLGANLY